MLRRRTRDALGLGLALTLLLPGCGLGGIEDTPPPGSRSTSGDPGASDAAEPDPSEPDPSGSDPATAGPYQPTDEDFSALVATLKVRARAVLTDDLDLYLSILDRRDPAFVAQQRTLFANLTALPLATYLLSADESYLSPDASLEGETVLSPTVVEHVQVAGVDVRPAGYDVHLTWVRRGGRWLLGAEESSTYTTLNAAATSRPWFGEAIAVQSTGPTVVLTDASRAAQGRSLLAAVRVGIERDAEVLGLAPRYDVLVDATSNGRADRMNTLDDLEAAAVSYAAFSRDVAGDRPSQRAGSRIKINPTMADEVIGDGRLMRHELAHFLTDGEFPPVPKWVSEGLAEYVAYAPTSPADIAYPASLRRRIQEAADQGPPSSGVFGSDPLEDYVASWCAVTFLVERFGMSDFRTFMSDFTRSYDVYGDSQVPRLLRRHFDLSVDDLNRGTGELMRQIDSL